MAFKLYHYDPSAGAAVAFAAIFGLTTVVHIWQMAKARAWFMTAFIIGGFCVYTLLEWSRAMVPAIGLVAGAQVTEANALLILVEAIGYLCRYISAKQTPNWTTKPYIGQSLLLLLAPALFAASVYMILDRIIRLLNAGSLSLVRPNWLTKVFVTGDVISFLMQCGGGGLLAGAKTQDKVNMGEHMIIGGLFVQILFFGFFMIVSVIFHRRMLATPMHHMMSTQLPWNHYMKILYTVSLLIMIRSVYRVAEYVQGSDGYLQSKEAFIYVFDAALMFACCIILNVSHPSKLLSHSQAGHKVDSDLEMLAPER